MKNRTSHRSVVFFLLFLATFLRAEENSTVINEELSTERDHQWITTREEEESIWPTLQNFTENPVEELVDNTESSAEVRQHQPNPPPYQWYSEEPEEESPKQRIFETKSKSNEIRHSDEMTEERYNYGTYEMIHRRHNHDYPKPQKLHKNRRLKEPNTEKWPQIIRTPEDIRRILGEMSPREGDKVAYEQNWWIERGGPHDTVLRFGQVTKHDV